MEYSSKKKGGFGLIEVVIAMALIAIISGGVYTGYMIIIKQTKDAQEKQITALIGKQVTEEIKLASGKTIYENLESTEESEDTEENTKLQLTNVIQLAKDADNQFSGELFFNRVGKAVNSSDGEYKAEIDINLKKTGLENEQNRKEIGIESIENHSIKKIYVVKQNGRVALLEHEPSQADKQNSENDTDETMETNIEITINADGYGQVSIKDDESQNKFFSQNKLQFDFKYYHSKAKIQVVNEDDNKLDLYILNSIYISENSIINRNVTVENTKESKASIREYYRLEETSKIGKLFNINIKVFKTDDESKPFFESNFVQNINIKQNESN